MHTAKLRVELSQSRAEQQEYLRNVETAKTLEKRVKKKREKGEEFELKPVNKRRMDDDGIEKPRKKKTKELESVLSHVF
jgi:ESF2/ABP1 family protein